MSIGRSKLGQLALDVDVPTTPAPKSASRKRPATQLARIIEEEAAKLAALARERTFVLEHDGKGVVVDMLRWRDGRRAA